MSTKAFLRVPRRTEVGFGNTRLWQTKNLPEIRGTFSGNREYQLINLDL